MRGPQHSGHSWAVYRAHGDPFPMAPDWIVSNLERCGVPFPQRGAWTAKALNSLALHDSNSDFDAILHSVPPNTCQRQVSCRKEQCMADAGNPPEGMDGQTALQAMVGGKGLYSEEPSNIAEYDYSKVKVLHSRLRPRRLQEVLPRHAQSALRRYKSFIERSPEELDHEGDCGIRPYWDPILKSSDSELVRLVVALANQGLITFRTAVKERIGLFFVKKKTPEWIRMVIDSRRVNAKHKPPPSTRLATPRSYLDIQFGAPVDGSSLAYGIEADVNDCFYNYYTEELASWFGIDRPGTVGFWEAHGWNKTNLFSDESQTFFTPASTLRVFPVFRGLCMGWAWSLYFANESVNYIANGMIERPLRELRDKAPARPLDEGPLTGVYVDNISIIGSSRAEVQQAAARVAEHFKAADIPLTWTTESPCSIFETVGLVLDFERGVIRNKPKRLWKAFFAGRELLRRRRVSGKLIEIWLGHMTSIFMLYPCALSTFFHIYRFVQNHRHHRAVLWKSVREEMKLAIGLMWINHGDESSI